MTGLGTVGVLGLFPVVAICILKCKESDLGRREVFASYGPLYPMIKTNSRVSKAPIFWSFCFLIRRIVIAVATVLLQDFRLAQVMLYIYSALAGASFILGVKPYDVPILNYVEVMNDSFLLCSSYLALLMCDLVPD